MSTIIPLELTDLPAECYLYKHSTQCSRSAAAAKEVRSAEFSLPLYWVNVIEQRPLSNWIAATYGVPHESPQLLLIRGGKVEQVWNHQKITRAVFS